jgi:hypothetical protein
VSTVKNFLLVAFYFVVLTGLAVLCTTWAVISVGRGEYLTVVVVLGFAAVCVGLMTSLVLVLRHKVRPRAEFSDEGTTIRPDRVVDGITRWGTLPAYIALATFAIFQPRGKIDIPLPPGNHQYIVIVAAGGALFGVIDVWRAVRPGGVSFVRLAADGFEMSQGSSSMDGAWDDVVAITDRRPDQPPPFRAMVFVKFGEGRTRTQVIDSYTPGGTALRRLVRYYWINPDQRAELTDGRAIERLADFEGAA